MYKGPFDQKQLARWPEALIVFGPALFIASAAVVDWAIDLQSPLIGSAEIAVMLALLVGRRYCARRFRNSQAT
jgi:hypothetical protein